MSDEENGIGLRGRGVHRPNIHVPGDIEGYDIVVLGRRQQGVPWSRRISKGCATPMEKGGLSLAETLCVSTAITGSSRSRSWRKLGRARARLGQDRS